MNDLLRFVYHNIVSIFPIKPSYNVLRKSIYFIGPS